MMGRNIKEGYRQGYEGPSQDDYVVNSSWGFNLEDIGTRIDIWQGDIDENVPLVQGKYQNSLLPNSSFTVLDETAHLFPLVRWKEILLRLIEEDG